MRLSALLAALCVAMLVALRRDRHGVARRRVMPVSAERHWSRATTVGALTFVTTFAALAGPPLPIGPIAVAVAWAGVVIARRRAAAAAADARAGAVADVVYALAAELRAGRMPGEAIAAAADVASVLSEPLSRAARAVRRGAGAPQQLQVVAALPGAGALTAVVAAWQVTEEAGGAVADVLERLGQTLDDDERRRRELAAALAGPKATMMLLAALPVLGLALGTSAGAAPVHVLVSTHVGWALLAGALVLESAGLLWARAIVRTASR